MILLLAAAYAAALGWVLALLAALKMVWVGWGGNLLGNHPHCRLCGYDLYLGSAAPRCPECAADLLTGRAIRRGARVLSPARTLLGIAGVSLTMSIFSFALSGAVEEMRVAAIPPAAAAVPPPGAPPPPPATAPVRGTAAGAISSSQSAPPMPVLIAVAQQESRGPASATMDEITRALAQPLRPVPGADEAPGLGHHESAGLALTSGWRAAADALPSFPGVLED